MAVNGSVVGVSGSPVAVNGSLVAVSGSVAGVSGSLVGSEHFARASERFAGGSERLAGSGRRRGGCGGRRLGTHTHLPVVQANGSLVAVIVSLVRVSGADGGVIVKLRPVAVAPNPEKGAFRRCGRRMSDTERCCRRSRRACAESRQQHGVTQRRDNDDRLTRRAMLAARRANRTHVHSNFAGGSTVSRSVTVYLCPLTLNQLVALARQTCEQKQGARRAVV